MIASALLSLSLSAWWHQHLPRMLLPSHSSNRHRCCWDNFGNSCGQIPHIYFRILNTDKKQNKCTQQKEEMCTAETEQMNTTETEQKQHLEFEPQVADLRGGPLGTQTLENYPALGTRSRDHLPTWTTQTTAFDVPGHILTYHLKLKPRSILRERQDGRSLDHN